MDNKQRFFSLLLVSILAFVGSAVAQTADLNIRGAKAGFPIGLPQLCDAGGAGAGAVAIPEVVRNNLQVSGFFKVLRPATYVETPGKCDIDGQMAYSDWSVINAEGVVKGDVKRSGDKVIVRLYLHDIQQQRAVVGKKYEVDAQDVAKVAHKFSNEIVAYFTGTPGVFGSRIAYVSRMGRFKEIFVMDMDGSNATQLTWDKGLAMSPAWSPTGDRLVYTSYKTRQPELYIMSPGVGKGKQLTNRPGLEMGAEFSPDGTKLISAASVSGVSKIALFDLKGRLLRRLTASSSIDVSPSWSPDGRRVAYCSNRAGGPQIYVMNADGSNPRRISYANSNYCTSPAWSPKGDKIAFVCRSGNRNHIFIGSPSGGTATQVTYSGNNEDPAWSPDGRYIALSSNSGGGARSINLLSIQTGQMSQITTAKQEHSQPAWSVVID